MKSKKLLLASLALTMALTPSLAGCEQAMSDFIIAALWGFEKPPEPSIKDGEFAFSVTYEVDGEQETVSSVYICEFEESTLYLDGWSIHWKQYIEDSELSARLDSTLGYLLLKTTTDGEIYLDLNLSAKYFMSDPHFNNFNADTDQTITGISPRLFIEYNEAKYEEIGESYSEDAAVLEGYGVKIISFEYDKPIENSYE